MSDGVRFFTKTRIQENWDAWNADVGVVTRDYGDIPGILKARDVFVAVERDGKVYFELRNKSVPYVREI